MKYVAFVGKEKKNSSGVVSRFLKHKNISVRFVFELFFHFFQVVRENKNKLSTQKTESDKTIKRFPSQQTCLVVVSPVDTVSSWPDS